MTTLLFVITASSFALQDEDPWHPEPETLFAPGVEVEEVIVEDIPQFSRPANEPQFDNDARILKIFDSDTEQWSEFSYPDAIPNIYRVEPYEGDFWLLSTIVDRQPYGRADDPAGQWLLNIKTRSFTRPEMICGQLRETRRDFEGNWVTYYETPPDTSTPPVNSTVALCHTKTLDQRTLVVSDIFYSDEYGSLSPDETKVALIGDRGYYIYDLEADTLIRIGELSEPYDNRSIGWLGNEYIVVREDWRPDSMPQAYISLGEATKADSLTRITSYEEFQASPWFEVRENPERYEWIDYREDGCYLEWIETETGHREAFFMGGLCEVGTLLTEDPFGDRLFSPYSFENVNEGDDLAPSVYLSYDRELVRFNPFTGERIDLLRGEIEAVLDIDPESNYAAIVLDDNGFFDLEDRDVTPSRAFPIEPLPNNYQLAILDLHTGEILYQHRVESTLGFEWYEVASLNSDTGQVSGGRIPISGGQVPMGNMFSIGAGEFIVRTEQLKLLADGSSDIDPLDDQLVEVRESSTVITPLSGIVYLTTSENTHFLMLSQVENLIVSLSIYSRETGKYMPLIPELTSRGYFGNYDYDGVLEMKWQNYSLNIRRGSEPDIIEVMLHNNELQQRAIYRVRLPE